MKGDSKTGKLFIIAAVALALLLSATITAQKYHPDVVTNNLIIKLILGPKGLENENGKTFVLNNSEQYRDPVVYEDEIKLESWMLIKNSWNKNETITAMENKFESIEEKLALEVWMMQTFNLEDKILEEELELEEWMLWDADTFTPN